MNKQEINGDRSVQISEVRDSNIEITIDGTPRVLPLERPRLSVGPNPSPARLIGARAGLVDFVGRDKLLRSLEAWAGAPDPFAMQVIAGQGGSGKTRLAIELCLRLGENDWLSGFLAERPRENRLDALIETPKPRLILIDYAENRAEQLEMLLPALSDAATAESPVRLLLLIRTGALPAFDLPRRLGIRAEAVERLLEASKVIFLEKDESFPLEEREQLFALAVAALGPHVESSSTTDSPSLDQPVFESPLLVVIAAYLAASGENIPSGREQLLDGLLTHERRYWGSSATDLAADDALLDRIVALATLMRSESESQASALLKVVPDLGDATTERRNRLARWVQAQYPGSGWWNPLEPDILGEHLIASCFADQPGVLRDILDTDAPAALIRPLEVLTRAATDHPRLAATVGSVLSLALPHLTEVAVAQAKSIGAADLFFGDTIPVAAALALLVPVVDLEVESVLTAIQTLPGDSNLVLADLATTLYGVYVEGLRAAADGSEPDESASQLAIALNDLGNRLSAVGRIDEALDAATEAVQVCRSLRSQDRRADNARLALALSNLSNTQSEVGLLDEALASVTEAVQIDRKLGLEEPGVELEAFSTHLNTLGLRLKDVQRHEDALAAYDEALKIRRFLATKDPPDSEQSLAIVLENRSISLAAVGHRDEALASAKEAVDKWRILADSDPAAHLSSLAGSLISLSNRLSDSNHDDEGLTLEKEALEILRQLAEKYPDAYTPRLAALLNNLSATYWKLDRPNEAREMAESAVALRRRLVVLHPAAHKPELARALRNLATSLGALEQHDEALAAILEAVEIRRPLVSAQPHINAVPQVKSLRQLARYLSEAQLEEDAAIARREADHLEERYLSDPGQRE